MVKTGETAELFSAKRYSLFFVIALAYPNMLAILDKAAKNQQSRDKLNGHKNPLLRRGMVWEVQ